MHVIGGIIVIGFLLWLWFRFDDDHLPLDVLAGDRQSAWATM
jgi:hypothetical protein